MLSLRRGARRAPALPAGAPVPAPPSAACGDTPLFPPPSPTEQEVEPGRDRFPALPGRKWLKRGAFGMHGVICARCKQAAHGQSQRLSAPSCSPSLCSRAGRFRPASAPDDKLNPGIFTGLKIFLHGTSSTSVKKGAAMVQSIGH